MYKTVEWLDGKNAVKLIDQTKLPLKEKFITTKSYKRIAKAIKIMEVRGAPAIGVAAGMGMALAAIESKAKTKKELIGFLEKAGAILTSTRPTAVNLFWAVERMLNKAKNLDGDINSIITKLINEAKLIAEEDIQSCINIGKNALELIKDNWTIQTICNAGSLATAWYGTVGGVIREAFKNRKGIKVYAAETRPRLQGARLTVYEFMKDNIPVTLITDSMIGTVFAQGRINCIVVGADRILKTGHVINKIGTYTMAIAAKYHNIPFYVAAPLSTFDLKTPVEKVIIEERSGDEIRKINGKYITVPEVPVYNPAFDITPPELITAIITEKGVIHNPNTESVTKHASD